MFFVLMYVGSRGAQRHAVVMVNDLFSDLPFFLVVKNPYALRSQIHFWILTKKNAHLVEELQCPLHSCGCIRKKNSHFFVLIISDGVVFLREVIR